MIVSAIIALITLAAGWVQRFNGTADYNRQQADYFSGKPVNIIEIRKFTSQPNTIWVKVPSMLYFAVKKDVTIIGNTDFGGVYQVVDTWKKFPDKDPAKQLKENIIKQILFGYGVRWDKIENLPFVHGDNPGVLELKTNVSLPNHNEVNPDAEIFTGYELKRDITDVLSEKLQSLKNALFAGPNAWKSYVIIGMIILVFALIFSKDEGK